MFVGVGRMLFSKFDKILFVSLVLILGIVFFASALGSVDVTKPYHILQQISKSSTDLNSIDADGDGLIDLANKAVNADKVWCDGSYKDVNSCGFGGGGTGTGALSCFIDSNTQTVADSVLVTSTCPLGTILTGGSCSATGPQVFYDINQGNGWGCKMALGAGISWPLTATAICCTVSTSTGTTTGSGSCSPNYDSGWFSVQKGYGYIKDHGLGVTPVHVVVLQSTQTSGTPTSWTEVNSASSGETGPGYYQDSSKVYVWAGYNSAIQGIGTGPITVFANANGVSPYKSDNGQYRVLAWKDFNCGGSTSGNGTTLPTCSAGEALVMTASGWGCKAESVLGQRRLISSEVTLNSAQTYDVIQDNSWGATHLENVIDVKSQVNSNWSKLFDASMLTYIDINQSVDLGLQIPDALAAKPVTVFIRVGYLDKFGQDVSGVGNTYFQCGGQRGTCTGSEEFDASPGVSTVLTYSVDGVTYNNSGSDSREGSPYFTNFGQIYYSLGSYGHYCKQNDTEGVVVSGTMLGKNLKISSTRSIAQRYVLTCPAVYDYGTGLSFPPSKVRIYEIELWAKE